MERTRLRSRIILWAPVAVLLAYEFYLSSQSTLPTPPVRVPAADKLAHTGYFFLVAVFAVRAGRFGEGWSKRKSAVAIVVSTLVWGLLDEYHQSMVPMRSVEALDVAADVLGALIGASAGEPLWRLFGPEKVAN